MLMVLLICCRSVLRLLMLPIPAPARRRAEAPPAEAREAPRRDACGAGLRRAALQTQVMLDRAGSRPARSTAGMGTQHQEGARGASEERRQPDAATEPLDAYTITAAGCGGTVHARHPRRHDGEVQAARARLQNVARSARRALPLEPALLQRSTPGDVRGRRRDPGAERRADRVRRRCRRRPLRAGAAAAAAPRRPAADGRIAAPRPTSP